MPGIFVKHIRREEEQARHKFLMNYFRDHNLKNDPWMSSSSENEEYVLDVLGDIMRQPISVYSWGGPDKWISFNVSGISGMQEGEYRKIIYEKIEEPSIRLSKINELSINDKTFWVPPNLNLRYEELAKLITRFVDKQIL